jgi:hypothetical protein
MDMLFNTRSYYHYLSHYHTICHHTHTVYHYKRQLKEMLHGFNVTIIAVYREYISHMISYHYQINRAFNGHFEPFARYVCICMYVCTLFNTPSCYLSPLFVTLFITTNHTTSITNVYHYLYPYMTYDFAQVQHGRQA